MLACVQVHVYVYICDFFPKGAKFSFSMYKCLHVLVIYFILICIMSYMEKAGNRTVYGCSL